ncbi:MAG: histidine--tRNA ligase [Candidatus Omnitrophica bacterium]|nr:histidine--tRNA ligase [Candidatus Omnitrophota bacterium]
MFKRISGTKDILPDETPSWQEVEDLGRKVFSLYNYREVRPPLLEEAKLFSRSLGEFAEVVQKQMFLVKNQDELYALRPEATASVARAYIENNLDKTYGFLKLYYTGAMFRLERPQKGRLRQFHHIGCEAIGSSLPEVDIEVISLANRLLEAWQVNNYTIKLNSLGCSEDKSKLSLNLRKALKSNKGSLCEDCKVRYEKNTLRILDCKNEACQEIVSKISLEEKHLCPECKAHFETVKNGLQNLGIRYEILPQLVRGLDYYTRTIFEIKHDALGTQDAIGAGGRYDNLLKELGGPDVGAMGFAFGVERILLASCGRLKKPEENLVYIITMGEKPKAQGLRLLQDLRREGIAADTDYEGKSLKGALRRANDLRAKRVLIIGEDELKKQIVTLKDMGSGEQKEIKQEDLIQSLRGANGGCEAKPKQTSS